MAEQLTLAGCGTALVTPFQSDENIDLNALRELVNFQVEAGIDFLVPCGTTGESATLSLDEHLLVVETVIKQTNGRVPVISGAGSNNTKHAIELSRECEKLGVSGLLLVAPYYNKPSQEGLYRHFKTISDHVHIPIVLYNVPGRTASHIAPETVRRLGEIDQVIGVKEASGDMGYVSELMHVAGDAITILSGDDVGTLSILALGGRGVISVISNEMPAEMTRMVHAALDNDFNQAREMHVQLHPLMMANFIETNPVPVKAVLSMMGKIEANYRLPLTAMSSENYAALKAVVKAMGLI